MTNLPVLTKLRNYLLANNKIDLQNILVDSKENENYSLFINFITLFEEDPAIGNELLIEPEKSFANLHEAALSAQKFILDELNKKTNNTPFKIKVKVYVRIVGLPMLGETIFPSNNNVGSFMKLKGTIIKAGTPRLLEYQRDYICFKCNHITIVKAAYEKYNVISPPIKCSECHSTNIKSKKEVDMINFVDYQEIKLQEHFGKSKVGTVPHTISVTLEGDLVDSCKPGDDIIVVGILLRRWKLLKTDSKFDIELSLKANNLEVCNEQKSSTVNNEVKEAFSNFWNYHKYQELMGRNHIVKSFCPQVYGLNLAKLAIVVVLAGGVQKIDENGCSVRGMSHLLLVGDAGTGKSHLLRYACKISGRSVVTTGIGSTTAGLTVTAVRENGDWNLEAGALVLADGGVCCIDDFNSIREHDRTSIHEAMEQQSISVAKAGIVTKLQTRCSVFATTSTKGKYDPSLPMSVNVAISSPLLSRFDIVLVLLDAKCREWDDFMFEERNEFEMCFEQSVNKTPCLTNYIWSANDLKNYYSVIKSINPVMTEKAGIVLRTYYQFQRMADSRNAARTTVRLLESLIRLSQGHARLMFRDKVTVLDAITAIILNESSVQNKAAANEVNALHTIPSRDPYGEYKSQVEMILHKLKLNEILEEELQSLREAEKLVRKNYFFGTKNDSMRKISRISENIFNSPSNTQSSFPENGNNNFSKNVYNQNELVAEKNTNEVSNKKPNSFALNYSNSSGFGHSMETCITSISEVKNNFPEHCFTQNESLGSDDTDENYSVPSKRMKLSLDEDKCNKYIISPSLSPSNRSCKRAMEEHIEGVEVSSVCTHYETNFLMKDGKTTISSAPDHKMEEKPQKLRNIFNSSEDDWNYLDL